MRARKKPVDIEFFKYHGDLKDSEGNLIIPDWAIEFVKKLELRRCGDKWKWWLEMETTTGVSFCFPGDYIIKDNHGEVYPCHALIFEEVYEIIDEEEGEF
jgi:hypothetical protein